MIPIRLERNLYVGLHMNLDAKIKSYPYAAWPRHSDRHAQFDVRMQFGMMIDFPSDLLVTDLQSP